MFNLIKNIFSRKKPWERDENVFHPMPARIAVPEQDLTVDETIEVYHYLALHENNGEILSSREVDRYTRGNIELEPSDEIAEIIPQPVEAWRARWRPQR